MLAAVYHGPHDLRVEEVPIPEIGKGEILVKVLSAGVCGTDLRIFRGEHRNYPPGTVRIPGHEVVGSIIALGEGVRDYTVGQRVFCAPNTGCGHCAQCLAGNYNLCEQIEAIGVTMDGGFAEYIRLPASSVRQGNVIAASEEVNPAVTALVEPFACVVRGQRPMQLKPGELVLVMGAGPIGVMHLKLARARGAGCVIVSEPMPERRARLGRMGADRVVDPFSEDLSSIVLDESHGQGAVVVIVATDAHAAQESAPAFAAVGGRINFFGALPQNQPTITLYSNFIHHKELFLTGTSACSTSDCLQAAKMVEAGLVDLSDIVSQRFPLKDARQAFEVAGERKLLKIVLEP